MLRHLAPALVALAATAATAARADDCDYVGRHYKTDLAPTGGTSYGPSRSGDIYFGPSVALDIQNVGVNAIEDLSGPGSILHARQISMTVNGQTLYGWLPAPLAPGQSARVSFDIPDGLIETCALTTYTIDTDNGIGQHGCAVHGNDAVTFTTRFGSHLCLRDAIDHGPIIIGGRDAEDAEPTPDY